MASFENREKTLEQWRKMEAHAEQLVPLIGSLYRERNVVSTFFGERLVNQSVPGIIAVHKKFNPTMEDCREALLDTRTLLNVLKSMPDVRALRFDCGKTGELLADRLRDNAVERKDKEYYVMKQLASLGVGQGDGSGSEIMHKPRDVVLYGFGRIGRLVARLLAEKTGDGCKLLLRAIVVRKAKVEDIFKRASLLQRDSTHGVFMGSVEVDAEKRVLIVNGSVVHLIYSPSPDQVDYTKYGINNAIVIDNTGIWRDDKGLGMHLKSPGVSNVILTAPGKGTILNYVAGVNDHELSEETADAIISAASCTTNAICPPLKVIDDAFGIVSGHIESVHSYTNDQNLIDNFHKKARRGRAACLNMVLTETGAGTAVVKCIPSLAGKLTANAIRVPTPNVSLAILMLELEKEVTKDEINNYLRDEAETGKLQHQLEVSVNPEGVSSDFVGNRHAAIVDPYSTIVDGNRANLYVWYDNEYGYSCQVMRLLQKIANIDHPKFPSDETFILARKASMRTHSAGSFAEAVESHI